jgi:hypothetical protein
VTMFQRLAIGKWERWSMHNVQVLFRLFSFGVYIG